MTTEQKGLRLASAVALIAFGPLCSLAAYPPFSAPMVLFTDIMLWPIDAAQSGQATETRLLFAILGGIAFGWGIMIWQLAGTPLARHPELIRPILRTAILAWFVLDSIASLLVGSPLNVLANIAILALFLIPMHRGRRADAAHS